jgi:hypothetical protein
VPGQVEVREDGDSLYILKALLDVKTQSEHINDPYSQPCNASPAVDAHNESVERTLVLPQIVQAVNTAPEYAPLRRAFMARIIAQWVRDRYQQGKRTSFDKLIDSGDLGQAKLGGGWSPKDVFNAYVRSYRDKEFDITRQTSDGDVTRVARYVFGGVDLTNTPLTTVTAAQMSKEDPQVAQSAQASAQHPVTAADGSIWLGGSIQVPKPGLWAGLVDGATRLTRGNGLLLVVILVALGVILFGFRTRPRRGGRTAA